MAQQSQIGRTATTIATDNEGYTVVTYHNTQVVRFNNDEVYLNTGGWWSATTKTRMNQTAKQFGLGFSVFQKNDKWFVKYPAGRVVPYGDNNEHYIRLPQTAQGIAL